MTQDLPKPKDLAPLVDHRTIPNEIEKDEIRSANINDFQKEKFARGELVFVQNVKLHDGRIVDAKLQLEKADNGEFKIKVFEKKEVLEIPNEILKYKLSEQEKSDLLAEKTVGIKIPSGQHLFLQVDKDLNRIMVKTERDLSIIAEIGKYKLTDQDKQLWVNGEKLPTRIFYDDQHQVYFAASIRKTEDGKGIEYHNYKSLKDLSQDQVTSMMKEYNSPQSQILKTTVSVTNSIKLPGEDLQIEKHSFKSIEVNTEVDNDKRFVEYTNNKDYEGLKRLASEGYKPEKDLIDRTAAQLNMNTKDKENIMTAIRVESEKKLPVIKPEEIKVGDPIILKLNNKPYKILELTEDGKKALIEGPDKKKIGVSVEHIRLMSKKEKGMLVSVKKNVKQEQGLSL
jgi:hypothetical protein